MANVVNQRDALLQASNARIVDVELKPNILQAVRGIRLSASGSIFKASAGGIYAPAELTVQASLLAFSGQPTLTWMVSPEGSATLTGSDYGVRTLKFLDMAQNSCVVRVEVSDGVTTYSDQVAITKVWEGPLDKDFTPPPTPLGFSTSSALSSFFVTHTDPSYQQGHGHLRTRVYGKIVQPGDPLPTFSDATEIAQFTGNIYAHSSNPSTTWRLWIKWETVDGVLSTNPAGGVNGMEAVTGQDVAKLIEALTGEITESQLYQRLKSRIDLIDGPAMLSGSINQRIASEQVARADEIQAERQARVAALLAEAQARGTAISSETQSRITADSALQSQITMLSATGSDNFSELLAAIQEEQTARIDGDTAEATQRITLAAQVTELVAADEYNALERIRATASLTEEQTVRAAQDEALSQRITTLSATVGQNAATLTAEQTARATADEALSSSLQSLTAKVNTNTASITSEQQARATADSALTSSINYLQTQVSSNAASITSEATTRATADSSLSSRIDTLTAAVNTADAGLSAAIQSEAAARASADSAEAQARETLAARVTGAEGSINTQAVQISERYTKAETDLAISSSSQALSAAYQAADAATLSSANAAAEAYAAAKAELARVSSNAYADGAVTAEEQRAIADASAKAEAARVAAVNAAAADATAKANAAKAHADAGILSEQTTRANADSALASSITTLGATVNSNNTTLSAAIQNEATARANADASQASQISTLQSTVATRGAGAALNADPNFSSSLAWDAFSGPSPQFVSLADGAVGKTAIRSSAAGVMNWVNEKARIPVNPAKAYRAQGKLRTVSGSGSTAYLGVALFDADGNNISGDGSQWHYFASAVSPGAGWAAYSGEFGAGTSHPFPSNARTMTPLAILSYGGGSSIHEAQDLRIEDLTDVKQLTASIQTEATTRASQTGDLFAQYTVKIDTAGRVSGFGLASTAAASGTNSSEFAVRADRFYIAPPADFTQETAPAGTSGKVWYKPSTKETFRYDGAAWVAFNPIVPFTVQATPTTINGVAVPAGVYMDAAFIKDGTITNAKVGSLSADKLTAGTIAAARIGAGSITATHIDSRGLSIKDASGNVILAAGTALDFDLVGGVSKPESGANKTYVQAGIIYGVSAGAGTAVSNDLVQVGGANLLPGSSNGVGWSYGAYAGTAFSLTAGSTGESGYIYSPYFSLWGGQEITVSFESKEDAQISSRDFFLLPDDYPSAGLLGMSIDKSTAWSPRSVTFTTPSGWGTRDAPKSVRLRMDHNGSTDGSVATIHIRNVKIELGNKATGWSPAPADVAADAQVKADSAANWAVSAAQTYAAAQASLSKTQAQAYADGIVSAEEQRAINDAAAKAEAARVAAVAAADAKLRAASLGLPLEQWSLSGQQLVTTADGKVGNKALRLQGNGGYPNQGNFIQIDRAKTYRTSFWARPSADCAGLLYFTLRQFAADGNLGPINGGRAPYKPSGYSKMAHDSQFGAGQWGFYSYTWSASDWQDGVTQVCPDLLDNYPNAAGHWDVQAFEFYDITEAQKAIAAAAADATAKANAAQQAAQAYAAAQASLAETQAKAHADGRVSAEEVRAIADAAAKAEAARVAAVSAAAADASAKANVAATTATWAGIPGGSGKPEDNATVGAPNGTYVGDYPAHTVAGAAEGYVNQVRSFYVPGSREVFYPVAIHSTELGGAVLYDFTLFRESVHEDATWLGSYNCNIRVRASAWGNAPGTIEKVEQRTGSGNYPWAVAAVNPSWSNQVIWVWLRGGMTHKISMSQPIGGYSVDVYEQGYTNGYGTVASRTDAPLSAYLNIGYYPDMPTDFAWVGGATRPANNANNTYLFNGTLQGVSEGVGTSVSNNLIGINASGQLYGAGAGNGIPISNNQIYLSDGALQGIGGGAGTVVANSKISVNADGTLNNAGGGQITLPGLGLDSFRVVAWGLSATTYPNGAGAALYNAKTGAVVVSGSPMYRVVKIRRSDNAVFDVGGYNTLAGGSNPANMAAALNAIGSDHIVVVFTYDEPQGGRLIDGLAEAMYRCGASRAVFGSVNFRYRSAYALIGIPGCGEGNGAEFYQGTVDLDQNAWVDASFSVVNGNITGVTGGYTPRSLTDYGYVGDLNATVGAPVGTYVGSTPAQDVESQTGAQLRADAAANWAVSTAQTYAAAKADLARISAEAHADGIVSAAEQRAISDASNKAEAARVSAVNAAAQDATAKANVAATTATWAGVSGSGKPADGATRNEIYSSNTAPSYTFVGSLWLCTADAQTYKAIGTVSPDVAVISAGQFINCTSLASSQDIIVLPFGSNEAVFSGLSSGTLVITHNTPSVLTGALVSHSLNTGMIAYKDFMYFTNGYTTTTDIAKYMTDGTPFSLTAYSTTPANTATILALASYKKDVIYRATGSSWEAYSTMGAPAGTLVGGTLAQTVESNAATALSAANNANTALANKLDKASSAILSVASSGTTYVAGLRVGDLAWDSSGNRTSGKGIALTPKGILGHNGSKVTFSVDADTGDAFFGGSLEVGAVSASSLYAYQSGTTSLLNKTGFGFTLPLTTSYKWNGGKIVLAFRVMIATGRLSGVAWIKPYAAIYVNGNTAYSYYELGNLPAPPSSNAISFSYVTVDSQMLGFSSAGTNNSLSAYINVDFYSSSGAVVANTADVSAFVNAEVSILEVKV